MKSDKEISGGVFRDLIFGIVLFGIFSLLFPADYFVLVFGQLSDSAGSASPAHPTYINLLPALLAFANTFLA